MKREKSNKTISVVMCTCNGESFIQAQIDSIINQTTTIHELIICDDCSTDQTIEIIHKYQIKHPFIQLICNNTRLGVRKNFEQAIRLSSGDYIATSDQDDIWETTKIAILMDHIVSKKVALVHSDTCLIDTEGNPLPSNFLFNKKHYLTLNNYIFNENNVTGCTCLFDAQLKKSLFPFPLFYFYHDQWIAIVAYQNGGIAWVDDKLVRYRQHTQNALSTLGGGGKQNPFNQIFFRNKAKDLSLILSKAKDLRLSFKMKCKLFTQIIYGIIGVSYIKYKLLELAKNRK